MPGSKWKSPFLDWEENNQDANLAFTLVALNQRARELWADPHNTSRYVPASFLRGNIKDPSARKTVSNITGLEGNEEQLSLEEEKDTEPALHFRFNDWPKSFAKGYVLGSDANVCDALLGDPGDRISPQMLAFTFNRHHQLVMSVTSDKFTLVKYGGQKEAERMDFRWIFPRSQKKIRVKLARVLEFDIVLPKYGMNEDDFHNNCASFLKSAACGNLLADGLKINSIAATGQASGTPSPQNSFYLRGKKLGSGAYGDVYKVLRMLDGKVCAAKRFRNTESFEQEVNILKKVCKTHHRNIVQFVEEWHEDYNPLLIMEYVPGGNLIQRIEAGMGYGEIANLANQTLAALVFLHDQCVMHRDIKPANILCVTQGHYKLADFGVSKEVAPLLSRQGTEEYMAPEVHDLAPYSYSADIWSLGVVLFECMSDLPNGRPGIDGRKWCEEVLNMVMACQRLTDRSGSEAFELIVFVQNAMLHMDSNDRLSARKCLEVYQHLWDRSAQSEDQDAGSGANTPTQVQPNGSFPPNPYDGSEDGRVGEESSSTARCNGEETVEGRVPQNFFNEVGITVVTHSKAGTSFPCSFSPTLPLIGENMVYDPSSVIPWPTSIDREKSYDPSNVAPWPKSIGGADSVVSDSTSIADGTLYDRARIIPSVSSTGAHTRSESDSSTKRQRDSRASAEGDETDGSVTPGRRAPYHPGDEVAAPGLDYSPANHWVRSPAAKQKRVKSSATEPVDLAAQGQS